MYKINCKELTGEECDFVAEGGTKEEVKERFYAHGAESPIHKEKYHSSTDEEASAFGQKIDEYLSRQVV
jgi:predicted small metal-binding protein